MVLSAEWRTNGITDSVLIIEDGAVRAARVATAALLNALLTDPGDLSAWPGDRPVNDEQQNPAAWGRLVIARAQTGEVITMDPEAFWEGIYEWFRSRGVDYDTPVGLTG